MKKYTKEIQEKWSILKERKGGQTNNYYEFLKKKSKLENKINTKNYKSRKPPWNSDSKPHIEVDAAFLRI